MGGLTIDPLHPNLPVLRHRLCEPLQLTGESGLFRRDLRSGRRVCLSLKYGEFCISHGIYRRPNPGDGQLQISVFCRPFGLNLADPMYCRRLCFQ